MWNMYAMEYCQSVKKIILKISKNQMELKGSAAHSSMFLDVRIYPGGTAENRKVERGVAIAGAIVWGSNRKGIASCQWSDGGNWKIGGLIKEGKSKYTRREDKNKQ